MRYVCAYITCSGLREAKKISRALVGKRLVACANIIPGISSVYRWEGKVRDESEALVLAKTTSGKKQKIISEVRRMHGYENPAILFYEIAGGSGEYLAWLRGETT